jgi:N6-L-threonylcarbamoyladenine synthase
LRQAIDSVNPTNPLNLVFPPQHLCTGAHDRSFLHAVTFNTFFLPDNAVMIAWAAMHRYVRNDFEPYDVGIKVRWDLEEYTKHALTRAQWVSLGHSLLFITVG